MTPYRLADHLSTFRSYQPPSEFFRSWTIPLRLAFKTVYLTPISVSYILHVPLSGMGFLFILSQQPPSGPGPPHSRGFQNTHDTPQLVGLLWTGDRPVAERPVPDNTQHLQQTDIHATRWDSNPQSQQASGRTPTS